MISGYSCAMQGVPRIVILGCGFGGLWAAQHLRRAKAEVTVVDRTNHHLFTPLLYQVATAGLSAPDIAGPIRHILAKQRNATVLMANLMKAKPSSAKGNYLLSTTISTTMGAGVKVNPTGSRDLAA